MLHADAPDAIALTYDEIIFGTRNRAYGAFNLRQQYRPTLTHALWLGVGLFLLATVGFAQVSLRLDTTVYTVVEKQPEFPGGFGAIREYLMTNIPYPPAARSAKIKGRVFVSFVVERDGYLTHVNTLTGLGYGCDEEAVRVIKAMPRWTPGSQSGRALRVKYNLPVLFGMDYPLDYPRHSRH